jgi:ribosome-associated heat shock protein Hsp15
MTEADSIRVDRWLCAARVYKSRTQAQTACEAGHVRINGVVVKPAALVRVGDEVAARPPRGVVVLEVLGIEAKRQSPGRARELFADHSPPSAPHDDLGWVAPRRKGRPTKSDRRALERLRRP